MEKYSSREDNPSKGTDYEKNICMRDQKLEAILTTASLNLEAKSVRSQ